jgi:hypothetical protein
MVIVEESSQQISSLNCAMRRLLMRCFGDLLTHALVRPRMMIILAAGSQNVFQMPSIDDKQVIQAILPSAAHPTLRIGVGVWCPVGDQHHCDALVMQTW